MEYLGATIETVIAQTCGEWELIVLDDGSSDGSADVVRRYRDPRIRLLQQANRSPAGALAAGLKEARGESVAFLDQDDLWARDKLAAHLGRMRARPELALTFVVPVCERRGEALRRWFDFWQ